MSDTISIAICSHISSNVRELSGKDDDNPNGVFSSFSNSRKKLYSTCHVKRVLHFQRTKRPKRALFAHCRCVAYATITSIDGQTQIKIRSKVKNFHSDLVSVANIYHVDENNEFKSTLLCEEECSAKRVFK